MSEADAVADLEMAMAKAVRTQDFATLQALVAPEFRSCGVRSTGSGEMDLAKWLEAVRSLTIHELAIRPPRVEVYGDAAITLIEGNWRAEMGGMHIQESFEMTAVWLKRDGAWMLVRRHSNPVWAP
jgi:ketosteroid isomerase-like protein